MADISPAFRWTAQGAALAAKLEKAEGTPEALEAFIQAMDGLTDYDYWYFLSVLWVSHSAGNSLTLWRGLFDSDRPRRKSCIMKPSEVKEYDRLPWFVTAYRAHHNDDETDWISYTLDIQVAKKFASIYGAASITQYKVKKRDIIALFTRRKESEIIVLNPDKVEFENILMVEDISDESDEN